MRKIIRRIVATFVLISLVCMELPMMPSHAADMNGEVVTEDSKEQQNIDTEAGLEIETPKDISEQNPGENIQEENDLQEENEIDQDEVRTDSRVEGEEAKAQYEVLNYLYLGSTYVESPATQNIMVSWGDGSENVTSATLYYLDDEGNEWNIPCSRRESNTYLFSKEFTDQEKGIYRISKIEIERDDNKIICDAEQMGITAIFGVDEEYTGHEVSEHLDMEPLEEETTNIESSVVVLSEEGTDAVENISEALDAVETQNAIGTQNFMAPQTREATIADKAMMSAIGGDLVVVLDPGHDASHTGAQGNGVREEVATLKIAQYCKEELERYSGVKVYMTRTTAACPYPETIGVKSGNILDIKKRVQWAKSKGADVFVSFHLNASSNASANGAQVFYPEAAYAGTNIASQGAALSNKIQQELLKLGLQKRVNDDADYAVNTESAACGFPGLIIEHAFVSNANDANNFLNSDEKLKKLGVADATGIASYYGLSKDSAKVKEGTYFISTAEKDGNVITAKSSEIKNGTSVFVDKNINTATQRFEIMSVGGGYYKIISEISGLALDVAGGSSQLKTNVQLYSWNNTNAQKWRFVDAKNGYYYIQSALGLYLKNNNGSVWMYTNDKSKACQWKLTLSSNQPVKNGTYSISTGMNGKKVVDVSGASIFNGANVQIYDNNNSTAQHFEIEYVGEGYYRIVSEKSNKVLDIKDSNTGSGANVQIYGWNGSNAQLWKFVELGDGTYYIKSKLGTVLNLAGANTSNQSNINAYAFNGSGAQKWKLTKTEYKNISDGQYVIKTQANKIDVLSPDSSGNVKLNNFANFNEQKYNVSYISNGYYKIINAKTGKSLDVSGGSRNIGANLQEYAWNGSAAQLWKFIDNGSGGYYIKSKCGTYIDIANGVIRPGNNIQMYSLNGGAGQKWTLSSSWAAAKENPVEDGTYYICSTINSNKVLDVAGGSTKDGANIQLYSRNNTPAQRFDVEYVGNGYYRIISEASGKVLDIQAGSSKSGTNVWQYGWNNTSAQLWRFVSLENGEYCLRSKLGTTLDLSGASTKDGANIQVYEMNGTNAQKWKLVKFEGRTIADGKYVLSSVGDPFKVLSAKNGNLCINTFDNISSQKYNISLVKNGYYKIINCSTGKAVTVSGNSKAVKANIAENDWNGSDGQLWKFIKSSNNSYCVKSKLGTYMDIDSGQFVNDRNVWTYSFNGSNAQKWYLKSDWASYGEGENVKTGTYYISSLLGNNAVIDVNDGSLNDGARMQIYTKNKTAAQRFEITYISDGYYKITNEKSDKALDVAGGSGKAGTRVQQYKWNGSSAQLWKFIPAEGGGYYLKSKLGFVLDVTGGNRANGTGLQIYSINGTSAQKWQLTDSDYTPVSNGSYVAFTKKDATLVLDIESASTSDDANLQLYSYNGTDAQRFQVQYNGKGYYKIVAKHSNKALTISGDSQKDGANIVQRTWNGKDGQLWKFVDCGDGTYYIKSKLGTVIEVESSSLRSGANIQAGIINNETWQKWGIYNPENLYKIMGNGFTNVKQMVSLYKSRNATYPYKNTDVPTIDAFCQVYIEECQKEGVKVEVAFCQAMLETGFLRFGGDVKAEQYNFAGIGATGGVPGHSFRTIREGIRAQVQHLKAYASTEGLKNSCVDPRFHLVKRGCAPYVEWLGIKENPNGAGWAAGAQYGYNIMNLVRNLKAY